MSQSNVEFEGFRWYVVHTYSGYENKVMNDLMTKVKNIGMEDEILEAVIPMESVTEIRDVETVEKDPVTGEPVEDPNTGEDKIVIRHEKRDVERKKFTGYVFVRVAVYYDEKKKMYKMTDRAWYVIRNTRGVTGFVGSDNTTPLPLSDAEVKALDFTRKSEIKVNFAEGDYVSIISGGLTGFSGPVTALDAANNKVTVMVSMAGRMMPLDLTLDQVEKAVT